MTFINFLRKLPSDIRVLIAAFKTSEHLTKNK